MYHSPDFWSLGTLKPRPKLFDEVRAQSAGHFFSHASDGFIVSLPSRSSIRDRLP